MVWEEERLHHVPLTAVPLSHTAAALKAAHSQRHLSHVITLDGARKFNKESSLFNDSLAVLIILD